MFKMSRNELSESHLMNQLCENNEITYICKKCNGDLLSNVLCVYCERSLKEDPQYYFKKKGISLGKML